MGAARGHDDWAEPATIWGLGALVGVAYLLIAPRTPDLAAQVFRAALFRAHGPLVYDTAWYGGHDLPGYSVLAPPLEALLGTQLAGVLATLAATVMFERLVRRDEGTGTAASLAAAAFVLAAGVNLFVGRVTFALGIAFGIAALLAVGRRAWLAAALAACCSLASPLAGVFLAAACVAWGAAARRRDPWPAAVAAAGVALGLPSAFHEGGTFPFPVHALLIVLALCGVLAWAAPRDHRAIRIGAGVFAALALAAWLVPSPLGGNVTRVGMVFGPPLLAYALWPRHRGLLLLAAPLVAVWVWHPLGSDMSVADSVSASPGYYGGVLRFLEARRSLGRVEIPFTRTHWEAAYVAPREPLARGWERQLDRRYGAIFYRPGALSPARYERWLDANAVRYVALPDVLMDPSSRAEAALVRHGTPYLRLVWRDAHWRVYAVRGATPLASPPATLVRLDPSSFTLRTPRAARVLVRLHWSLYWTLPRGAGCLERSRGGWTTVDLRRAGTVTVSARFSLGGLTGDARRCF